MIFQYEYFHDLMRNEWENITVGKKIFIQQSCTTYLLLFHSILFIFSQMAILLMLGLLTLQKNPSFLGSLNLLALHHPKNIEWIVDCIFPLILVYCRCRTIYSQERYS